MKPVTLSSGTQIPAIGFGTARLGNEQAVIDAVTIALDAGYRLVDTAKIYDNEAAVGKAIAESGIPRSNIFVTTKLWNDEQGSKQTVKACAESLKRLGLDYIDLYLIHWPATRRRHESWQALEQLQREGRIRNAGVSNYTIEHLQELQDRSTFVPVINQVEFHPFIYEQQRPLLEYCLQQGITLEGYSPVTRTSEIADPTVEAIAKRHNKTSQQIVLRWCVQHGVIPLPRAAHKEHSASNIKIFDFELSSTEMNQLNNLSDGERVTWDPAGMGK